MPAEVRRREYAQKNSIPHCKHVASLCEPGRSRVSPGSHCQSYRVGSRPSRCGPGERDSKGEEQGYKRRTVSNKRFIGLLHFCKLARWNIHLDGGVSGIQKVGARKRRPGGRSEGSNRFLAGGRCG